MVDRKVRVLVVDDHPLFRRGLALALSNEPEFEVVGEVGDPVEAGEFARHHELDVAIVDVLMPSVSGISVTQELRELQPRCRVLSISIIDEPCLVAEMLRFGADGFAHKLQEADEIVDAVRQVVAGIRYVSPVVPRALVDAELARSGPPATARLTRREREIFELMIRGYRNVEVAAHLAIAMRTVETHRQRILKKLCRRSIIAMQRMATLHGGLDR